MHTLDMGSSKHVNTPTRLPLCCVCTILVALGVMLAGCGEEPVQEATTPPAPVTSAPPASHQLDWLRQTDPVAPEQWLASRQVGRDLDLYDPDVGTMRQTLEVAALRFRDHPRMIANRAVQLEEMLKEKHIDERAPTIIVTLSEVPGNKRYLESFASLTQQYYNLRMDGLDREQAIEALKKQIP